MASNIAVKITADVIDLQTKFAIAKSESQALSKSFNDLAKQAASGGMTDKLKADMTQAAGAMLGAKNRTAELAGEIKNLAPATVTLGSALDGVNGMLGKFGLALGVGTVLAFGRSIWETANAIQHQAEVLNLSVVGYQALAESAKVANVEVETIDMALKKFNASQGQAQQQTGAQAEAFRQLGINAFDPAEKTLPAVAAALLKISNTAERARLETALFGRSGQELNPALEQWARGVDVLSQEMRAQGLIIDPYLTDKFDRLEKKTTTTLDKIKVGAAESFRGIFAVLDLMDQVDKKPAAAKALAITPPVPQRDTMLDQANAIATAIDTSRARIEFLRSNIALMQAQLANPHASEEMRRNMQSAIKAANDEIANLQNKKAFAGTGFSDAGAKEIAQARLVISEINADQTKGDAERRAAIDRTYDELLKSAKLNAAQRIDVEKSRNDAITQANRQAANEKRQIDQATAETEQRIAQIGFDTRRAELEAEVAAGTITRTEALTQMLRLTDQESAARLQAIAKAQQGYAADTTFYIQKEMEKTVAVAEAEAQKAAIRRQIEQTSANESRRIWQQTNQEIMSAEQTFTQALFSGRVGLLGALQQAGLQFAQAELQQLLKGLTERMLLKKTELAQDQTLGQLGLLFHTLFEGEKTAATAAGEAARLTTKESARTAGSAADVAAGSAQILNDAYKSAAGAYSAVVGIPVVGPILAPIAAGTAFAAVAAFNALTSFDVGTNYVPRDMPAMVHKGERIIPAADNSALMAALGGGAANQNGGPMAFHYHEAPGGAGGSREKARDMIAEFRHAKRIGKIK